MSDMPPPPPPPPSFTPPPGYVAYGGAGAAQGGFARIGGLAKALVAVSALSAVTTLVTVAIQYGLRSDAATYLTDQTFDFKSKLSTYLLISGFGGIVSIAGLVLTAIWSFRIAKNLVGLGRPGQSFRAGSTIPVALLGSCTLGILPFLMWREFWRGSDPAASNFDTSWKKAPYATVLTLYFAFTLAAEVLGFTAGSIGDVGKVSNNATLQVAKTLHNHFPAIAGPALLQAGSLIAFIVFVRQLAARHMQATGEA